MVVLILKLVKTCVEAGANILVAGSFLFNQDDLIIATNKLIR